MKTVSIFLILAALSVTAVAQPCLSGWQFRQAVVVDNTANPDALTNHQAKVVLNTQSLIVSGQMQASGGDLRVLSKTGSTLSFWIENNTVNTPSTNVWVKIPSLAANSADTIYLFYGRESASSLSNGINTFEFFDDFDGSFLNPAKWDDCGGGTITVAGGQLTLGSSSFATNIAVKSATAFTSPIICEADVTTANQGIALLGQVNGTDEGSALAYEQLGTGNKVMRLVNISSNGDADTCIATADQLPTSNSILSGTTLGTWYYAWTGDTTQEMSWPGGSISRLDTVHRNEFADAKHFFFANVQKGGSVAADWVRVRKFTAIEPILTLSAQEELVDEVDVTQTGPYCQGDTIFLFAPTFVGATYTWFGPNGFSSSDEDPFVANAAAADAGTFVVSVALAAGCSPQIDSTEVAVSTTTLGGALSGTNTVCVDTNAGTITLSGNNGDVQRWELSSSMGGPWTSIENTTTSLTYSNLINTTYYRAFVKSGDCLLDTSTLATVTVDAISLGGNVLGAAEVCESDNSGNLNLINQQGVIQVWEMSTDGGGSWSPISGNTNSFAYSDLSQSSWFRVEVQNGVCPSVYSDTSLISVIPALVADFSTTSVCHGLATDFTNTSVFGNSQPASYIWNFGDGQGSSLADAQHTYTNAGNYTATLAIASDAGCVDTTSATVTVHYLPQVSFSFTNVCDTLPMAFTDQSTVSASTISAFEWSFGDGSVANTSEDPVYTYTTDGDYEVWHWATSAFGCVDSTMYEVSVYPRAYVGYTATSVCHTSANEFSNTTAFDPLSVQYTWVLGDGSTSNDVSPSYTYADTGVYAVTLQSTTNMGCLDFVTDTVEVYPLPVVDFSVDDECIYDTFQFANLSTIGSGTMDFTWGFGDGATSVDTNTSHQYAAPLAYFVELDAVSNYGCTGHRDEWVQVYHKPVAAFSFERVCESFATPFANASTLPVGTLSYAWNFGDTQSIANLDFGLDPLHVFTRQGSYETELIVTSDFGCQDSITKTIEVFPLPNPNFGYTRVCDGLETPFADSSAIESGSIISYLWDFGDATSSVLQNPTRLYLNDGQYVVKLTTASDRGCVNDTAINITVWEVPVANFTVSDVCWSEAITPANSSFISTGTLSYDWAYGDGQVDTLENPEHTYINSELYEISLLATTPNGCTDELTKFVEVFALPTVDAGVDTNVSQGFEYELQGSGTLAAEYLWTPTTGLVDNAIANPSARPLETTTYTLLVTDVHGCQAEDDVTIEVIEDFKVLPQNIITPDGNGVNDTWIITNAETFAGLNLYVYDRWGTEVLSQKGYDSTWGGVAGTDQLPDGTYYYVINFDDSDRTYKGSVTIIRNQQ